MFYVNYKTRYCKHMGGNLDFRLNNEIRFRMSFLWGAMQHVEMDVYRSQEGSKLKKLYKVNYAENKPINVLVGFLQSMQARDELRYCIKKHKSTEFLTE